MSRWRFVILVVCAVAGALALVLRGQPRNEPEFGFGADPTVPIVSLVSESRGGSSSPTYVLYASGRFEYRYAGRTAESEYSFEEIQGLLLGLARCGLLDLDAKELDRRLIARGGSPMKDLYSDAPWMTLTVALDRFSHRGREVAPFRKTLRLKYTGLEKEVYPDVPELVGFEVLVKELLARSRAAEKVARDERR